VILLATFGGLGDLLVTLPSMAYLRRTLPGRDFTLLCRGEYGSPVLEGGIVDRIIPLEGRAAVTLFGASVGARPELLPRLGTIEAIVVWARKPLDPTVCGAFELRAPGRLRVVSSDEDPSVPLSRLFYERTKTAFPAGQGRAPDFDECARLPVDPVTRAGFRAIVGLADSRHERFAVIHPGSGGEAKCWPFSGYLEIIRRLAGHGIPGILATGEAEERPAITGRLESGSLPSNWIWARRPPLGLLSGMLADAHFYLGNDSGVTHLAAACGSPVLALFRDEGLPAWRPFGRTRVLSAPKPADIGVDRVWDELINYFLQSSFHLL